MASNASTISEPNSGEFGDRIETDNADAYPVEQNRLFVTNKRTLPIKFQIDTAITVQPGNRVLSLADYHNTGIHKNSKLSGKGEFIGIYDSSGNVIDTFTFGAEQTDISMGRFPEVEGEFYFFNPTSPGTANLQSSIFSHSAAPVPNREAGFYPAGFLLTMTTSTEGGVVHFTTDGKRTGR